jgi:hypothetical protein
MGKEGRKEGRRANTTARVSEHHPNSQVVDFTLRRRRRAAAEKQTAVTQSKLRERERERERERQRERESERERERERACLKRIERSTPLTETHAALADTYPSGGIIVPGFVLRKSTSHRRPDSSMLKVHLHSVIIFSDMFCICYCSPSDPARQKLLGSKCKLQMSLLADGRRERERERERRIAFSVDTHIEWAGQAGRLSYTPTPPQTRCQAFLQVLFPSRIYSTRVPHHERNPISTKLPAAELNER